MDKIKTVKIKNPDGSVSEETYTISVDAKDVDMANGKELQETIGTIDIDTDGNIASQLNNLKNNKINQTDIIDNLISADSNKVLSANQGKVLKDNIDAIDIDLKKKAYFFNTVADMKAANLKVGDYACTLGYYEANDGGRAEYQILNDTNLIADAILIHDLSNGLKAQIMPDSTNVINICSCGAKMNDNSFINNADIINKIINTGYDCYIPRGDCYITKTISINLLTGGSLFGSSTASRIIKNTSVKSFDGDCLCEVYDGGGNYYTESRRAKNAIHDIGLIGLDWTLIGLKIGGDRDTEKEGATSYVQYFNMHIYKCKTALLIQDHSYKINFYNIWWTDCTNGLRTRQPIKDAGEVINFFGCGLFSGGIYTECAMQFFGCTIHLARVRDVTLPEGIAPTVFAKNQIVNFTDCHFERIGDGTYDQMFVSQGSIMNITRGDFATGSKVSFKDAIFKTITTPNNNGNDSIIRVKDTQMRWFLGRSYAAEGYENDFIICKGNVELKLSTKAVSDETSCIPYQIYDSTQPSLMYSMNHSKQWYPIVSDYKKTYAFAVDGTTFGYNETNKVLSVHIPTTNTSNNFGFYKLYNVHDYKSINVHIDISSDSDNVTFCLNTDSNNAANCLLCFDKDGNLINSGLKNGGYWRNGQHLKLPSSKEASVKTLSWFALPDGCEYVLFGIGGFGILGTEYINITINELYCEFL